MSIPRKSEKDVGCTKRRCDNIVASNILLEAKKKHTSTLTVGLVEKLGKAVKKVKKALPSHSQKTLGVAQ